MLAAPPDTRTAPRPPTCAPSTTSCSPITRSSTPTAHSRTWWRVWSSGRTSPIHITWTSWRKHNVPFPQPTLIVRSGHLFEHPNICHMLHDVLSILCSEPTCASPCPSNRKILHFCWSTPCELVKVLFGDRSIHGTVSHEQRVLVSTSKCTFSSSMFWSSPLIMCHFINLFLHPPHQLRCLRRVLRDITWPNRSTFQQGVTHCKMCPKLATACQRLPLQSKQLLQVLETCSKTHFEHVLTPNLKRVLIPLSLPVRSRPRASDWEWSFVFKFNILDALYTHILVRTKYTLMVFFVPSSSTVFVTNDVSWQRHLDFSTSLSCSSPCFSTSSNWLGCQFPSIQCWCLFPRVLLCRILLSLCLNNRKETSSVLLPSLSPEVTCSGLPLLGSACIKANKFPLLSSRKQEISFKNNFMSSSYTRTVFSGFPSHTGLVASVTAFWLILSSITSFSLISQIFTSRDVMLSSNSFTWLFVRSPVSSSRYHSNTSLM